MSERKCIKIKTDDNGYPHVYDEQGVEIVTAIDFSVRYDKETRKTVATVDFLAPEIEVEASVKQTTTISWKNMR